MCTDVNTYLVSFNMDVNVKSEFSVRACVIKNRTSGEIPDICTSTSTNPKPDPDATSNRTHLSGNCINRLWKLGAWGFRIAANWHVVCDASEIVFWHHWFKYWRIDRLIRYETSINWWQLSYCECRWHLYAVNILLHPSLGSAVDSTCIQA